MSEQSKGDGPLERLARIRPIVPRSRFLISWDPETSKLWYGLGSGKDSVRISSERELEAWTGTEELGARLDVGTVKQFIARFRTGGRSYTAARVHDPTKLLRALRGSAYLPPARNMDNRELFLSHIRPFRVLVLSLDVTPIRKDPIRGGTLTSRV